MSEFDDEGAAAPDDEEKTDPLARFESILAPLRDKHDEIAVFPVPKRLGEIVVVAAPTNGKAYQVYTNNLHNEQADKFAESRKFALACIVYPDFEKAKEILTARPGLVTAFSNRGAQLAGAGVEELGKD